MFGIGRGTRIMQRLAPPTASGLAYPTILTPVTLHAVYLLRRWFLMQRELADVEPASER